VYSRDTGRGNSREGEGGGGVSLPALPRVSDDVTQLSLSLSQRPTRPPRLSRTTQTRCGTSARLGSAAPRTCRQTRRSRR
jgi:hypothetical protein